MKTLRKIFDFVFLAICVLLLGFRPVGVSGVRRG